MGSWNLLPGGAVLEVVGARLVSFAGGARGSGRHQSYEERMRRNREVSRRYQAKLRAARRGG